MEAYPIIRTHNRQGLSVPLPPQHVLRICGSLRYRICQKDLTAGLEWVTGSCPQARKAVSHHSGTYTIKESFELYSGPGQVSNAMQHVVCWSNLPCWWLHTPHALWWCLSFRVPALLWRHQSQRVHDIHSREHWDSSPGAPSHSTAWGLQALREMDVEALEIQKLHWKLMPYLSYYTDCYTYSYFTCTGNSHHCQHFMMQLASSDHFCWLTYFTCVYIVFDTFAS